MKGAIHITHEAAQKIGGIGAVLSGLCTTNIYQNFYHKTFFFGPLFQDKVGITDRLGPNSKVLFSSLDGIKQSIYDQKLQDIVDLYHIDVIYGQKEIFDDIDPQKKAFVDIILLGIKNIRKDLLDTFKFRLWENFRFSCEKFEQDWDFEQYLRIAIPIRSLVNIFFQDSDTIDYYSHEYMGVATCLNILMDKTEHERIIFYAHEVSTARMVTEKLTGHDISFYHLLKNDKEYEIKLEERFGSYAHFSRNELVKLASLFDEILAVGDWVKSEYLYLNPATDNSIINICYNGIPIRKISYEQKQESRKKLQTYCENLFNFTPDVIMTHVSRLVISKGLWRDISLLEELDNIFAEKKIKGFFILLSSLIGTGRPSNDILNMEKDYGWPVWHKENWPDLVGYENDVFWSLHYFNAKSKAIKGIFLNQYGFEKSQLGNRFPDETNFSDLRIASDMELGMSIYEPFGIAQIETVPYGGIAVVSRACGCAFLLEKGWKNENIKAFHIIDFAENLKKEYPWATLTSDQRSIIEKQIIKREVKQIFKKIPKTDKEREKLFNICQRETSYLEWEDICKGILK